MTPLTANPLADPVLDFFRDASPPALDPYRTFFLAHLTAKTQVGGVWNYDWAEQTFDRVTGLPTDANPGRSGGIVAGEPVSPAVEANNNEVPVPVYAFMRQKGIVNGQVYYEFIAPTTLFAPTRRPTSGTSGGTSGSGPTDDGQSPPSAYPGDYLDPVAVRDVECVQGTLYRTTGRQQVISDAGRARLDWYDLKVQPIGCCACSGSGSGPSPAACCPDGYDAAVDVVLTGPFGAGCAELELNGTATFDAAAGGWVGTATGGVASALVVLSCTGAAWHLYALVTLSGGAQVVADGTLDDTGEVLEGTIPLTDGAECVDAALAATVGRPCTARCPGTCVAVPCVGCQGGFGSSTYSFQFDGDALANGELCFATGSDCVWGTIGVTLDGHRYSLTYDAGAELFVLTDLDTDDVWTRPKANFDCAATPDLPNTMTPVAPNFRPDALVWACGGNGPWKCTTGGCIAAVDGTYDTKAACEAAGCGGAPVTTTCCGSDAVPATLNVAITSGACSGTSTVTYDSGSGRWVGDVTTTGSGGTGNWHVELYCDVTTWKVALTGCDTIGGALTGTCSPLNMTGLPTASPCCGGTTFTVHFTE